MSTLRLNDTNYSRLYGSQNQTPCVKDAFHDHIIPSHHPPPPDAEEDFFSQKIRSRTYSTAGSENSDKLEEGPCTSFPSGPSFVNPNKTGTKSAAHCVFKDVPGQGGCSAVRLKLTPLSLHKDLSLEDESIFDDAVKAHCQEANEFYSSLMFGPMSDDFKQIMRQALGGMLWTKQYYKFIQKEWLEGDPAQPPPPPERKFIRNWANLFLLQASIIIDAVSIRNGDTCTPQMFSLCLTSMLLNVLVIARF